MTIFQVAGLFYIVIVFTIGQCVIGYLIAEGLKRLVTRIKLGQFAEDVAMRDFLDKQPDGRSEIPGVKL